MKVFLVSALVFFSQLPLQAQDEFEKVQVLESPRYSLLDRFVIDADFTYLPLDAYYKPLVLEAAVSYQFHDLMTWEIGRFGYSLYNYDTGLEDSINNTLSPVSQQVDEDELYLKRLRFRGSSTFFLNVFYSKSNFFNKSITYHQWQIGAGPSFYDMKSENQLGLDFVLKVRFFLNNQFSLNIRGGHTIGFKSDVPKNITFLTLGAGFAL